MSHMDSLERLRMQLRAFAAARDWGQYHTPKNIASALVVESAELLEHFQWLTAEESRALPEADRLAVSHEAADVLLYLVQLCDVLDIDLASAAQEKLAINEKRFAVARRT